jgi:DNA-binding CsgD family transcriptional regulator
LIAQGKTNREIGYILGISNRTVQIHVSHVYDKIGAQNRAGATLWLTEHQGRFD